MGLSYRLFIVTNVGLKPLSLARWARIHTNEEALLEHAGQELLLVEVVVEVERRTVRRAVRVLPHRAHVDSRGMIDREGSMRRAILSLPDYVNEPTIESEIAKLQRDASYFWVPTEEHWSILSRMLGLPIAELKRALRHGN